MAAEQDLIQTINHESSQSTKMAIKGAENSKDPARLAVVMPQTGSQVLKQPSFDWKAANKYLDLRNIHIL